MTTKSEDILARNARYQKIERAPDALGRVFGVRRLKPSQQLRIQEMAPNLEGTTSVPDGEGKLIEVSRSAPLLMAAAVCEVDGDPISFARNRAELDAVLDMLDTEGLVAVAEALVKLVVPAAPAAMLDEAKN